MAKLSLENDPLPPLPATIAGLAVVMAGLELIFSAGASGLFGGPDAERWRFFAILDYGFMDRTGSEQAGIQALVSEGGIRLLTYPLIHYGFSDALISIALLLAMSKLIARFHTSLFLIGVFFFASAAGGVGYAFLTGASIPLVGSSPGLFGMLGALTCAASMEPKGPLFRMAIIIPFALFGVRLLGGIAFGMPPVWMADAVAYVAGAVFWFFLWYGFGGAGIKH